MPEQLSEIATLHFVDSDILEIFPNKQEGNLCIIVIIDSSLKLAWDMCKIGHFKEIFVHILQCLIIQYKIHVKYWSIRPQMLEITLS